MTQYVIGWNVALSPNPGPHTVVVLGKSYDTGGFVVGPKLATAVSADPRIEPVLPKDAITDVALSSHDWSFPDATEAAALVQVQTGGGGGVIIGGISP